MKITYRLPIAVRVLLWAAEVALRWQRMVLNHRGWEAASRDAERAAWREAEQLAELQTHLRDVRSARVGRKWTAASRPI